MSFLDRLKKGVGIGDTTVALTAPDQITGDAGQIAYDIILTAGSPQLVTKVSAFFSRVVSWEDREENYVGGTGPNGTGHTTMTIWTPNSSFTVLGSTIDDTSFTLANKEARTLHVVIPLPAITAADFVPDVPSFDANAWGRFQSDCSSMPDGSHTAVVDRRGGSVSFQASVTVALEDAKDKDLTKGVVVTSAVSPPTSEGQTTAGPTGDSTTPPPPYYAPPAGH